jgi:hypothetical protein
MAGENFQTIYPLTADLSTRKFRDFPQRDLRNPSDGGRWGSVFVERFQTVGAK